MTSVSVVGRADLTDAQWAWLEPLLPRGVKAGRPPKWTKRQLIDGIRWRTRTGAPWRDVPVRYGQWQTIYGLFRRWQRGGRWVLILTMLQAFADAVDAIIWQIGVDSTIMRAHQHAAGARRGGEGQKHPPGGVEVEPADRALGRSHGGWTTKLHLACEQGLRPLALLLTGGQAGDSPHFTAVLASIRVPRLGPGRARVRPDRVLADKAYSSRANRVYLRQRVSKPPSRSPVIRRLTAATVARPVVGHRPSTPTLTETATLSNTVSTNSSKTGLSQPDTTNSPSVT